MFATTGAQMHTVAPSLGGLILGELTERYESDPGRRGLAEKTRQAHGTVFRALRELLGESKLARNITREDCRRVQKILCSLPPNACRGSLWSCRDGQGTGVASAAPQDRDELP